MPRAREEDEVRDVAFADVAGTFESVYGEEVYTELDGTLGVADRGAFMEDGTIGCLQLFDHGPGTVACCFDYSDALIYDYLGVAVVIWWDKRGEKG